MYSQYYGYPSEMGIVGGVRKYDTLKDVIYGVAKKKGNQRYGTLLESVERGQVRHWGVKAAGRKSIEKIQDELNKLRMMHAEEGREVAKAQAKVNQAERDRKRALKLSNKKPVKRVTAAKKAVVNEIINAIPEIQEVKEDLMQQHPEIPEREIDAEIIHVVEEQAKKEVEGSGYRRRRRIGAGEGYRRKRHY